MAAIPNDRRWCPLCGGDMRHVRRRVAPLITTFIVCQWPGCGHAIRLFEYDETTGRDNADDPNEAALERLTEHLMQKCLGG